jgi:hypothetical protein
MIIDGAAARENVNISRCRSFVFHVYTESAVFAGKIFS